jgi:outer membrane protein OmpA-like peptidoglycan-associated protein
MVMTLRSRLTSFRATATITAVLCTLGMTSTALGQTPGEDRILDSTGAGADLHLFRPAVDARGFFSVNGASVLPGKAFSFGFVLDYGHGLMPLSSGHGADYMVDHALQGTFNFNYGLFDRLVIGLSAPVVLNWGTELTDIGPGGAGNYDVKGLTAQGLGAIALHAKLMILPPTSVIGVALVAQGGVGVAQVRNFGADPGFFYWPQLILEKQFGEANIIRLGLNAGFRGHTGTNASFGVGKDGKPILTSGRFEYGNVGTAGFAASVRFADKVDLTGETYATYLVGGGSDSKQRVSAEVLGGVKIFVQKNSYLYLAGGIGYMPGFQSADQRGVLGFVFEPANEDRDHDGITDDVDLCPDEPEDPDGDEDADGCPEQDPADEPVKVRTGDSDGDGILDVQDQCPNKAEDLDGFQDTDGCPELDNDKDGIPDANDACMNVAEDKDGWKDEDGCPEDDNDSDGIVDSKDECPNEPETFNNIDDENGCPDKGSVIVQDNNVLILEKIQFKTGSSEILTQSLPIVDAVAAVLKHAPQFVLLEVQGHADSRGAPVMNVKLTQDRSEAVVKALIERGIDRQRLRAMGFGPYCPIDPGNSAASLEKNRRVEFKIVRTSDGPTTIQLGCDKARLMGIVSPPP